ncbi:MAG: hypothetical protein PVI88_00055 [Nitrosopumilaceae archaeon]|jgi:hypothetical protein
METGSIVALITSGFTMLGGILTIMKVFSMIHKKAKEEGRKEEQFCEIIKDVNGYGKRLLEAEKDNMITKNKINKLENEISAKLDVIIIKTESTEKRMDRIENHIFNQGERK